MELKRSILTLTANAITALFIFLFVYASASKLADIQTFRVQLAQSPLLTPFAGVAAWFVPLTEIILALLLFADRTRLYGLYGSFTIMVMFVMYIIAITRFSGYVPCSCGGILEQMTWNQHLAFNLFFMALAVVGVFLESKKMALHCACKQLKKDEIIIPK